MNTQDLNRIQSLLKDERAGVADTLEAHLHRSVEDEHSPVEERVLSDEERLLAKIDLALSRIQEGTYGTCIQCSAAIPMERLLAKPSVSLCLSCQTRKEAGV